MTYEEIIRKLKSLRNPKDIEGMARLGITPKSEILGISIWQLRKFKKEIEEDSAFAKTSWDKHKLALELWASGIHEARILASFIDDPMLVTEKQLDQWVMTSIPGISLISFPS